MWWTGRGMAVYEESRFQSPVNIQAIVAGTLWGFLFLLALIFLISFVFPLIPGLVPLIEEYQRQTQLVLHASTALAAGLVAGRRSPALGWLHGALAAVGALLLAILASGVVGHFPYLRDLWDRLLITVALGALAGIIGINARKV
jgi:putative membrane protein (TIGR04086 family)